MLQQFQTIKQRYPNQFWLLFFGSLLSSTGGALVWPFLTIFLRERLDISLTTIAGLLSLNAFAGLVASFAAGPAADRIGRKWVMLISLYCAPLYYILMVFANSLPTYAILMAFGGAYSPLYAVGANAMVADLVEPEWRIEAYALLRMVHNVGVAVGPIIGGFMAVISYNSTFYAAAIAFALFGVITQIGITESLPADHAARPSVKESLDYGPILRDRTFMVFMGSFTVTMMAAAILFILLPVYAKENYAMSEKSYGFIITINALMCVFVQYAITKITQRHPAFPVLAIGAVFYAVGVGSIALGSGFWGFVISMIILTTGELIMSPTATTLAANLAPEKMRGRYMSLFGLAWPVASGVGPIIAGIFNDNISPVSMWYGGFALGMLSAVIFAYMAWLQRHGKIQLASD